MLSGAPQATLRTPSGQGDTVAVPAGLLVPKTYLIWSEVSYTYKPSHRLRDGEGRHHA